MKNAEDSFNFAVYFVLNKIMDKALPNSFNKFSYMFDVDVTRQNPITFRDEERAFRYLLENNVIEEVSEKDKIEIEERETPKYKAYNGYNLKTTKKFLRFYDRFKLKVLGGRDTDYKTSKKRLIKELLESKFRGKYEKKLLLSLLKGDKGALQLKEDTGVKNIYHLITRVRRKLVRTPFKIEDYKSGGFSELKKYRLSAL